MVDNQTKNEVAPPEKHNVDFSQNPKQEEFFLKVISAVLGLNDYRYFFYGGAIRGGKTYVCLAIFAALCKRFPKSKWLVFRADFPSLQDTTIPSMEKIIGSNPNWRWSRDKSNYYCEYINKSRIVFMGENISQDPELNGLLGVECNGILLEQVEELSKKLYEMALSRLGSWYIDPMPKPIILATMNPSQTWVKQLIYEQWKEGKLNAPFYFQQALPQDNAFVTKDQYEAWNRLNDRYKRQFIEGDWTDFTDNSRWCFAFDRNRHLGEPEKDERHYLYLSFDFNRNPICCSVIQHYEDQVKVLETIKLPNSNIYELCSVIKVKYPDFVYQITGDASGQSSSAMVKDNINYYVVIMRELGVTDNQLFIPSVNPKLEDNQVLVNSILQNYSVVIHKDKAEGLIYDMENVRMMADGSIVKRDRSDPTQQADCLDTFRYFCNTFLSGFLVRKEIISNIAQTNDDEFPFDFDSVK